MSGLSTSEKNRIKGMKENLAELLLFANKIKCLSDIEQIFLKEILTRHLKDTIGNYEKRIKEIYQDYYIVAGIVYRHTKGNIIDDNPTVAYLPVQVR